MIIETKNQRYERNPLNRWEFFDKTRWHISPVSNYEVIELLDHIEEQNTTIKALVDKIDHLILQNHDAKTEVEKCDRPGHYYFRARFTKEMVEELSESSFQDLCTYLAQEMYHQLKKEIK